jgi:hypothetical protein
LELNLNKIAEKLEQNKLVKNFIDELGEALENFNNKNELKDKNMNDVKFTNEEEVEFEKKEFSFFQNYFKEELSNLSKGEIYIVTNKYENDNEYHRYKVTQYKDNLECKYIAFEKDLPENVKVGDVVRKIDGTYIYDKQATQFVNDSIKKIKQEIIDNRNKKN